MKAGSDSRYDWKPETGRTSDDRTGDDAMGRRERHRRVWGDDEPFDPYSTVRRSKAYDDDDDNVASKAGGKGSKSSLRDERNEQQWPVGNGLGKFVLASSASGRDSDRRQRSRSRSPRPSHDDYEWKSKAGGVAIFTKKPNR